MDMGTLLSKLESSPLLALFAAPLASFVLWNLWCYISSPIGAHPGPFLAKWTNLWRLYHTSRGSFHKVLEKLHHEHGPVVRVGPNVLDVDFPDLHKTVFSLQNEWRKTEFYHGSSALVNGQVVYNLFSQTDPQKHARERKPIAKYYSMSSILALEPHMDKVIGLLCHELETRFIDGPDGGKPFDFGNWILYYTWDVVGAVTFSQPFGYLSQGRDFDSTLYNSERAQDYFSVIGTMPWLDYVFDKNPYYRIGPPGFGSITGVSIQHLVNRYQAKDGDHYDPSRPDFLSRFIEAKVSGSDDAVDDGQIVSWLMINMLAGADTTAITIRCALYHSIKHPRVWQRLRADLAAAGLSRPTPSSPAPPYAACKAIPYLDAVVREALRTLPGVSLSMERYVPAGGCVLPGGAGFVPEGVIVALNPFVAARNRAVFGADADDFRPERWLRDEEGGEDEDAYRARLKVMSDADLSFGGGRRTCIGKHMGLVQVFKVVATMVLSYDIELAHPERDLKIINSWFPRQEGFEARLSRRA